MGTVAQRTAITGGSTWLDSLLLAPGLHYQQAADELADESATYAAVEQLEGNRTSTYNITNPATKRYLQRVGREDQLVTVDVGMIPERNYFRRPGRSQRNGQRATIWRESGSDLGRLSHILYLASPILTVTSMVFLVLLQECKPIFILVFILVFLAIHVFALILS